MVKNNSGFTIVELLVVIVVIAILAAITVVSFSGIQDKARDVAVITSFDAYEKGFQIVHIQDGQYPAMSPSSINVCIGDEKDYPETTNFEAGQCFIYNNGVGGANLVTAARDAGVSSRIKEALGSLPSVPTHEFKIPSGSGAYWIRGLIYARAYAGSPDRILFVLRDQEAACGRGTKTIDSSGLVTCVVNLN